MPLPRRMLRPSVLQEYRHAWFAGCDGRDRIHRIRKMAFTMLWGPFVSRPMCSVAIVASRKPSVATFLRYARPEHMAKQWHSVTIVVRCPKRCYRPTLCSKQVKNCIMYIIYKGPALLMPVPYKFFSLKCKLMAWIPIRQFTLPIFRYFFIFPLKFSSTCSVSHGSMTNERQSVF